MSSPLAVSPNQVLKEGFGVDFQTQDYYNRNASNLALFDYDTAFVPAHG